ncbi:MAG: hypothetical protein ACK6DQ_05305, partial [Planctomycetota bacterium]
MSSESFIDQSHIKSLLQQTALLLQKQFSDVVFDQDRRAHSIRFEIRELQDSTDSSNATPLFEIIGHLEFEGQLQDVLDAIRPSYPLEILKKSSSAFEPNL